MQPPLHHRELDIEFLLTTGLIIFISVFLLVSIVVMMALGGVFLPFGFDSDLIAQLLTPQFLMILGIIILFVMLGIVGYTMIRRTRAGAWR